MQAVEARLPSLLANTRLQEPTAVLVKSKRQYAGIVRDGKHYLYVSNIPFIRDYDWQSQPVVICDGGRSVFGLEIEVSSGRVTRIDFNGP